MAQSLLFAAFKIATSPLARTVWTGVISSESQVPPCPSWPAGCLKNFSPTPCYECTNFTPFLSFSRNRLKPNASFQTCKVPYLSYRHKSYLPSSLAPQCQSLMSLLLLFFWCNFNRFCGCFVCFHNDNPKSPALKPQMI